MEPMNLKIINQTAQRLNKEHMAVEIKTQTSECSVVRKVKYWTLLINLLSPPTGIVEPLSQTAERVQLLFPTARNAVE